MVGDDRGGQERSRVTSIGSPRGAGPPTSSRGRRGFAGGYQAEWFDRRGPSRDGVRPPGTRDRRASVARGAEELVVARFTGGGPRSDAIFRGPTSKRRPNASEARLRNSGRGKRSTGGQGTRMGEERPRVSSLEGRSGAGVARGFGGRPGRSRPATSSGSQAGPARSCGARCRNARAADGTTADEGRGADGRGRPDHGGPGLVGGSRSAIGEAVGGLARTARPEASKGQPAR